MRTLIIQFCIASCYISVLAQQEKQVNYYFDPSPYVSKSLYIKIDDVVSKMAYAKMAIQVKNLSSEALLIKKEEFIFKHNNQSSKPVKNWLFIRPYDQIRRTFKVEDQINYLVDVFDLNVSGIYSLKTIPQRIDVPVFKLPVQTNQIASGDFIITMKNLKKKTKETVVTFVVQYVGNDIGKVHPSKIAARVPSKGENIFASTRSKAPVRFMPPGDEITIIAKFEIPTSYADMQFAEMEVVWDNVFEYALSEQQSAIQFQLQLDEALTRKKN